MESEEQLFAGIKSLISCSTDQEALKYLATDLPEWYTLINLILEHENMDIVGAALEVLSELITPLDTINEHDSAEVNQVTTVLVKGLIKAGTTTNLALIIDRLRENRECCTLIIDIVDTVLEVLQGEPDDDNDEQVKQVIGPFIPWLIFCMYESEQKNPKETIKDISDEDFQSTQALAAEFLAEALLCAPLRRIFIDADGVDALLTMFIPSVSIKGQSQKDDQPLLDIQTNVVDMLCSLTLDEDPEVASELVTTCLEFDLIDHLVKSASQQLQSEPLSNSSSLFSLVIQTLSFLLPKDARLAGKFVEEGGLSLLGTLLSKKQSDSKPLLFLETLSAKDSFLEQRFIAILGACCNDKVYNEYQKDKSKSTQSSLKERLLAKLKDKQSLLMIIKDRLSKHEDPLNPEKLILENVFKFIDAEKSGQD